MTKTDVAKDFGNIRGTSWMTQKKAKKKKAKKKPRQKLMNIPDGLWLTAGGAAAPGLKSLILPRARVEFLSV
jgi:hypothetical protein